MLKMYNMLSNFIISGFQDIALNVRGDFRTLNSVQAHKDYEDHRRLNGFSPKNVHETIMTGATMQLIET